MARGIIQTLMEALKDMMTCFITQTTNQACRTRSELWLTHIVSLVLLSEQKWIDFVQQQKYKSHRSDY
jgi:hypothetical protein